VQVTVLSAGGVLGAGKPPDGGQLAAPSPPLYGEPAGAKVAACTEAMMIAKTSALAVKTSSRAFTGMKRLTWAYVFDTVGTPLADVRGKVRRRGSQSDWVFVARGWVGRDSR